MILLVTHKDLDGAACEVVMRLVWGSDLTVWYSDYRELYGVCERVIAYAKDYETIIFADIAPVAEHLDVINAHPLCERFQIYDHHAQNAWAEQRWPNIRGVFDNRCGARILYESGPQYATLEPMETRALGSFLRAVDAWDRWLLDSPDRALGEKLQHAFNFYRKSFVRDIVTSIQGGQVLRTDIDDVVKVLQEQQQGYVKSACQRSRVDTDIWGNSFCWAVASRFSSEVGSELSKGHDYGAVVNLERGVVELRSTGGFNVGVLAKQRGGGGHATAAGYPIGGITKSLFNL